MPHYQGCTVEVFDVEPTLKKLNEIWSKEGITSAYVIVGEAVGYYNCVGEVKEFLNVDEREVQKIKNTVLAAKNAANTNIKGNAVELTPNGSHLSHPRKLIERLNALTKYSPSQLFRIPIKKPESETAVGFSLSKPFINNDFGSSEDLASNNDDESGANSPFDKTAQPATDDLTPTIEFLTLRICQATDGSQYTEYWLDAAQENILLRCGLLVNEQAPTLNALNNIEYLENTAYILANAHLYYVNKVRHECICLSEGWAEAKLTAAQQKIINILSNSANSDNNKKYLDLSPEQLKEIMDATGHRTKRWVSAKETIRVAGDLEEQYQQLCLLTGQGALPKQLKDSKTVWLTAIRPFMMVPLCWLGAAVIEGVLVAARAVVAAGIFSIALVGAIKTAETMEKFVSKGHSIISSYLGYKAAKRYADKYYQPAVVDGDDNVGDMQAVLEMYKKTPNNYVGNFCDDYLNGPKAAKVMRDGLESLAALFNLLPNI